MSERHDDRFFEAVKNELYAMEVAPPPGVYGKVVSQLGRSSRWFSLNAAALLLVGSLVAGVIAFNVNNETAEAQLATTVQTDLNATLPTTQSRILNEEFIAKYQCASEATAPQVRLAAIQNTGAVDKVAVIATPETITADIEGLEGSTHAANDEQETPAVEEQQADASDEVRQTNPHQHALPVDWQLQTGKLSAEEILNQLSNESHEIKISVPVTIQVEDKE